MKAILICPAYRPTVSQLAENTPLATVPIYGACLVNHWIEHLAVLGARDIRILATDRPAQVQAVVNDGRRWGVRVEVIATGAEATRAEAAARYQPTGDPGWLPVPYDIVVMSHLPGAADSPLFESYASWFAALLAWMPRALTPARVRVREIQPGIWVGSRARISRSAQLLAPCWIGDQVQIGPHAVIGPGTIIEDRAIIEAGAHLAQSHVGPDTLVGRLVAVTNSIAQGGTLTNWQTDSSLRVPDPFLLSSLARPPTVAALAGIRRAFTGIARAVAAPFRPTTVWSAAPAVRPISDFEGSLPSNPR